MRSPFFLLVVANRVMCCFRSVVLYFFFFFQAEDGIRDLTVTGVQTCALPILWQYKGMLFNPRYGRVGLIAMPFFAFGEMLAPLVEVVGYVITLGGLLLGAVNTNFALLFVLVAWGYGMLLSLWAVVLEEVSFQRYRRLGDLGRLLLFATLENFGYRQRTVWWRVQAFWSRSEEHTSELQSQSNLVCRLLLEKKKKTITYYLSH